MENEPSAAFLQRNPLRMDGNDLKILKKSEDYPMEDLCMEQLQKDGKKFIEVLEAGKLLVIRSVDDFVYFLDAGDNYQMFSHTAGQMQAGRRIQPKEQTKPEMFDDMAGKVDMAFAVEFDRSMDIPTVLYSAEEAILEAFPMVGEEEKLDFSSYNQPLEQ